MTQLIIEYKLVCPRKLELDSSLPSCCSIVVVHCASLLIKKVLWSFAVVPLCVIRWYPSWVWGVGLRWDDDTRKSRIMRLVCECRCLIRMKGLRMSWLDKGSHGVVGD